MARTPGVVGRHREEFERTRLLRIDGTIADGVDIVESERAFHLAHGRGRAAPMLLVSESHEEPAEAAASTIEDEVGQFDQRILQERGEHRDVLGVDGAQPEASAFHGTGSRTISAPQPASFSTKRS